MLFAMSDKVNRFKSRPVYFALGGLVFLLFVTACTLHPAKTLKSCRYHFLTLTFSGMDAGQTHWLLDVSVANPNAHPVNLSRMRFALLHDADTLLSGWNPAKKEIAPNDSQVVQTTLDLPNSLWKRLPGSIWSDTDAKFLITADAFLDTWVGQFEVPNAVHQTVHVNMPAQMAKYRDLLMQKMFSWPGRKLHEDVAPPPTDDGDSLPPDSSL